ncbi:Uncharacterised protein [Mycobacterium tuberculosis]|nr:Uncharacterised protein [Mycobacterium tuberculosis]
MNPLGRQLTLALGEAKDGPLFAEVQGKGQAQCGHLRDFRPHHGGFSVDHQRTGSQVAEAFEVGVLQAADGAEEVAKRQHVDKPQQIADQRR